MLILTGFFLGASAAAFCTELSALEKQLASLQVQKQSVDRQLSAIQPRYATAPKAHSQAVTPANFSSPEVPREELRMPAAPWATAGAYLDCPPMPAFEADSLINSAAKREDLSPALLRSVIKRESAFRPCAISEKGAQGLMQLMPATADQFGVYDPFDPGENIRGGAAFLKQLLNRYGGDIKLALSAYNAGAQRVEEAGGVPAIAETQNYVAAITDDLALPEPTNAMVKPDLHHVQLASPSLNFTPAATPVHLASTP